ncbi:hypothetical protein [Actinoplanes palleronii]|uniref:Uncharacterized protein n=1 Tax=Actinoplanes palleronii TaxID=113570 RepID=A0ABQ4B3Z2_9ACTN|nr:hypothetical protein [Actinoplanes palleronii]GIE65389.1 hypothetical protein Apa02nite_014970 [Actinoplanes palleronii]
MTTESPPDRMPATVREWTEILARIRFGTVKIGGKGIAGARIKLVAYRMANFADGNGTRVRPGIARLALDLEMEYRAVGSIVAHLRHLGLLGLVRAGKGAKADEYRLTLPVDLLHRDDIEVWSPTEQAVEIEKLSAAKRRLRKPAGPQPDGPDGSRAHAPEGHTDDAPTHAPVEHASGEGERMPQKDTQPAGVCAQEGHKFGGSPALEGHTAHALQGHATHQDLDTSTTHHSGEDVSATVTTSRASGPPAKPDSSPRPERCDHGLPGGLRADGRPVCALCRVAANRSAAAAPLPDGHIAPVIQLRTREAS